jgi:hypothetical protein
MASTIVLAVFIASTTTFDAGVAENGSFRHASFQNSDRGIRQLGRWLEKRGVGEFDRICVSGRPVDTPATRFWSTRKVPVVIVDFGQVRRYMKQHGIRTASAKVVAQTCVAQEMNESAKDGPPAGLEP